MVSCVLALCFYPVPDLLSDSLSMAALIVSDAFGGEEEPVMMKKLATCFSNCFRLCLS